MANKIPVSNPPWRTSYLAISISVPTTATLLTTLIEDQLIGAGYNLVVGQLAKLWREVQWQVDPETSAGSTVRLGMLGNLGTTQNSVVQKGISLVGQSDTARGVMNNVDLSMMAAQAVGSAAIMNLQLWCA